MYLSPITAFCDYTTFQALIACFVFIIILAIILLISFNMGLDDPRIIITIVFEFILIITSIYLALKLKSERSK